MNLEKTVNIIAIVLLLGLAVCALMVMQKTSESNAVTAEATVKNSKKRSKVVREVRLLTKEIESLKRDMKEVKKAVEDHKKTERGQ